MSSAVVAIRPRQSRLDELEQVIELGQRAFIKAGKALREIRDARLYPTVFSTFEAYCASRFGLGKARLYQIIEAAQVVENLSTNVDSLSTATLTEGLLRPLTTLKSIDDQRAVWDETRARFAKPTAERVRQVIRERFPNPTVSPSPVDISPRERLVLVLDDLDRAAEALLLCTDFAKVVRLHELLGAKIAAMRARGWQ